MTVRMLDRLAGTTSGQAIAAIEGHVAGIAEALGEAVRGWEIHLQPTVLRASLRLIDRLERVVREKLAEPKTHIARAIKSILEGTSDPKLAGFCLRALAIPPVRRLAVQVIGQTRDRDMIRALAGEAWLLADSQIKRGCLWVRQMAWFDGGVDQLLELAPHEAASLVRLMAATGLKEDHKISLFRAMLAVDEEALDQAVVWQLVEDDGPSATTLLTAIASRPESRVSRIAARELKNRGVQTSLDLQLANEDAAASPASEASLSAQAWTKYWSSFDHLLPEQQSAADDELIKAGVDLFVPLRAKLASGNPLDRARALRVVRSLAMTDDLAEHVYHLASDPDPIVRSAAVSLLGEMPGVTGCRILRRAVDDPEERVQANAIAALDALDVEDRVDLIGPKLESSNNRVRANAIKALLRLELHEAGDVLLDMLDDPSRAHRLSALWVVERLQLRAVLRRIVRMSQHDPDRRVMQRAERVLRNLIGGLDSLFTVDAPGEPHPAGSGPRQVDEHES